MRFPILFAAACLAVSAVSADDKNIVCYFGSWAVYRPGQGQFEIKDIDPSLCTHLTYTFVGLEDDKVMVLDPWQDLPDNWGRNAFGRFNALRGENPNLKTLVAIGGWNEGSAKYSAMARDPNSRGRFVKNVVEFVKKYNFDGFDIDWEYPNQRGGESYDVENFAALVRELSVALKKEGLLLSAAVGAAEFSASLSYNIPEISKHLDFINLMTYDLHGAWESHTGINAPLYPASSESGNQTQLNVDAVVKYWLSKGADPKKINVGTASYGRTFTLVNPGLNKVGDPINGPGNAGPYTREASMLGYNEICEFQNKEQWTVKFDTERRVPYAYRGNQWVGYDNIKSITEKAEYIMKMGLGGAMIWSIETDDFRGNCGDKYPLIKTLNHVLRNGKAVTERPPGPPKPTEKPTTPKPAVPSRCTKAGYIPDLTSCSKFILCVDAGNGKFTEIPMQCPAGLCFNPKISVCDWPQLFRRW